MEITAKDLRHNKKTDMPIITVDPRTVWEKELRNDSIMFLLNNLISNRQRFFQEKYGSAYFVSSIEKLIENLKLDFNDETYNLIYTTLNKLQELGYIGIGSYKDNVEPSLVQYKFYIKW